MAFLFWPDLAEGSEDSLRQAKKENVMIAIKIKIRHFLATFDPLSDNFLSHSQTIPNFYDLVYDFSE